MDKKSKKLKCPEFNVEYTFAISGKLYKRVLIDSVITSNGTIRLYFQDIKDNYVSDMSLWQFNECIRKHQIRSERRLEGCETMAEPVKTNTPEQGENTLWRDVTNRIRNIPETFNAYIINLIGYTSSKLADEMDNLDNGCYTKEYEYRVMRNVNTVVNFLDKYDLTAERKDVMQATEPEKVCSETLIKMLRSISPSMLTKCNAHFGYSIADLIDKLNNLSNKDKNYIDSIYKETDRVFYFVGYKKPVMA